MKNYLYQNELLHTLFNLKGNPRAAVYTEPLWGLSVSLALPYATVYMLALGMDDVKVGIVTAISMLSQMVFAFLSGVLVDKLGRRKSTALFDFLAWSIPCLIWAFSQEMSFFVVAAILNGALKVSEVAWDCLLVEDAPKDKITKLYSWVLIFTNISALFTPIASLLVAHLTLVPAMRILYINAFIIMTIKIFILYRYSTETKIGKIKKKESIGKNFNEMLYKYKHAYYKMINSRGTIFSVLISVIVGVVVMIGSTFWQIIASRRIGIPDLLLPIFPMAKSVFSIILFFIVISKINQKKIKVPLYVGFMSYIGSYILLIIITDTSIVGYIILFLSILLESFGISILNMLRESLVAIYVDPSERSGIMALLQTIVMLVSVPFAYLSGVLSDVSRTLPFALSMVLLLIGVLMTYLFYNKKDFLTKSF